MAIQEVIKYEGGNDVLIYKHPAEDFNTLSTLIVHESQEAVFFSDGQALDTFKAGRHTLETKNIPLISNLRNLASGGVSPFHAEVYFINLAMMMAIPWGTPSQVTVKDPVYNYNYRAGASGSFDIKIIDGRKLLINLVGTENQMSTAEVQKYFKNLIVTRVKNCIAVELSKYSFNEINQHLNEISDNLAGQIDSHISEYGIKVLNFYVSEPKINDDDLEELRELDNNAARKKANALGDREESLIYAATNRDATVLEAQGLAKARELQGYTWQQEQQFDVSRTFAENEGFAANPANMMAQIPLAFSMGNMINENVTGAAAAQSAGGKAENGQGADQTCTKCGTKIPANAKFCFNCGEKVERPQQIFCTECGSPMPADAKFCMNCGTRRENG